MILFYKVPIDKDFYSFRVIERYKEVSHVLKALIVGFGDNFFFHRKTRAIETNRNG